MLTRFCAELGGERNMCERIAQWLLGGSTTDRKSGDLFATFLAGELAPENFDQLRAVFFTKDNQPRKSIVTKSTATAEPELTRHLDGLMDRVLAVEARRRCAVTAGLTAAVVTVALSVRAVYDRLKQQRAIFIRSDPQEQSFARSPERSFQEPREPVDQRTRQSAYATRQRVAENVSEALHS